MEKRCYPENRGRIGGKIDDHKFAFQQLGTYDNHNIGISHREGDGSAEMHETQVDIFFVEAGEAILVVDARKQRESFSP